MKVSELITALGKFKPDSKLEVLASSGSRLAGVEFEYIGKIKGVELKRETRSLGGDPDGLSQPTITVKVDLI